MTYLPNKKKPYENIPTPRTYHWDSHVGVYGVFCDATHSVYIGQSKNCPIRLRNHRMNLRNGAYVRGNGKLSQMQDDFNKHGEAEFRFEQLCECEEEQLHSQETQHCVQYHSDGYALYNTFIHTEQTGLYCPKPFEPVITRIIQLLDKGKLKLHDLERGIEQAEYGS